MLETQIKKLVQSMADTAMKNGNKKFISENMIIERNGQWLGQISVVDYLIKFGKHFQAKYMISHEG